MEVRQILAAKGLKQRDIARATGLTPAYISQIFSGKRFPRWPHLESIASAMGLVPEHLYRLLRDQQRKEASVGV